MSDRKRFKRLGHGAWRFHDDQRTADDSGPDVEQRAVAAAEDAEAAAAEYRRALFDYTQLMRHRLINPLTAITAGLRTLVDLDLDRRVQIEILNAMITQAGVLQDALLNPYTVGVEEAALHPLPRLASDSREADAAHAEAGSVEGRFRAMNEDMIRHLRKDLPDRYIDVLCECASEACREPIRMLLSDYLTIHREVEAFVIRPQHHFPDIEDVVLQVDEWWVTRKTGVAAETVREFHRESVE